MTLPIRVTMEGKGTIDFAKKDMILKINLETEMLILPDSERNLRIIGTESLRRNIQLLSKIESLSMLEKLRIDSRIN